MKSRRVYPHGRRHGTSRLDGDGKYSDIPGEHSSRAVNKHLPLVLFLVGLFFQGVPAAGQDEQAFLRALSRARDLLRHKPDSAVMHAREAIAQAGSPARRLEARELCADALLRSGDIAGAHAQFTRLLRSATDNADAPLRARALNGLGVTERRTGNLARAIALHEEAEHLFDSLGHTLGVAQALHDHGAALAAAGRNEAAMGMYRRALAMREEEQFRPGIAESHHGIGRLHQRMSDLDSALIHFRAALSLRRQLGVLSSDAAATLNSIGGVYRARGDAARALDFHREALGFSRQVGDTAMIAATQAEIGAAFADLGDVTRARESYAEALRLAERVRRGDLEAAVMLDFARLEEEDGNHAAAFALLERHLFVTDSLRRHAVRNAMWFADDGVVLDPWNAETNGTARDADFLVFLVVVIALLLVIVIIALSALRLRGRSNAALSENNTEIERMNAELQRLNFDLARSEEKYRLLFEHLPVGVFLYDQELTLLQCNNAFADVFGAPERSLDGQKFDQLRDRRIVPALQAAIQGKTGTYEGEYLVRAEGQPLQVSIRTAPLTYRDATMPHGIGFVLDISNWKRIERELIESREIAVQADRLKNAFLTNISHEIRTPLNIIMGYFGILQQEMRERMDDEEADHFRKVDLAVRRLLRTVDQILTLSILESGTYAMNLEQCHLHQLAYELYEELVPLAGEKGLEVSFESACRDVYIDVDRYSVGQALRNLLDNAVKFTDAGTIRIALRGSGENITVIVSDTGIGMSEEYVRQMFEAFSQEDAGYSRSYEGLGLGLRLTKRYLDVNNGTIHVESAKGEGTTFTVAFPITHRYARLAPDEPNAPEEIAQEGPRRTLLVVEDDHETQKFLQLILSSSFDLHFADSGEDAWTILHRTAIDLVLMDISLRGEEDGLQLTGRIREDAALRTLPVIAVTAHAFADDRRRSLEAGCNEYLPKPFRVTQLRELVERVLI
jgi:PAS domain S-box-containing protein